METHFENMDHPHSILARERVVADLKSLCRDSEELLKATASDVSEKLKETRARVSAALEQAKETCEKLQEQTANTAQAATKTADTMIRTHPYECLGLAFGLGLLIGVLAPRNL